MIFAGLPLRLALALSTTFLIEASQLATDTGIRETKLLSAPIRSSFRGRTNNRQAGRTLRARRPAAIPNLPGSTAASSGWSTAWPGEGTDEALSKSDVQSHRAGSNSGQAGPTLRSPGPSNPTTLFGAAPSSRWQGASADAGTGQPIWNRDAHSLGGGSNYDEAGYAFRTVGSAGSTRTSGTSPSSRWLTASPGAGTDEPIWKRDAVAPNWGSAKRPVPGAPTRPVMMPEPETWLLFLVDFGGLTAILLVISRRRRRLP